MMFQNFRLQKRHLIWKLHRVKLHLILKIWPKRLIISSQYFELHAAPRQINVEMAPPSGSSLFPVLMKQFDETLFNKNV